MNFGFRLLAWRRHRDLSQVELAEKAGVVRPYLSRLERGKVDPSLSLLLRLSGALDVRVGQLVEEDPPTVTLDRHTLDDLARGALQPGKAVYRKTPYVQSLSRLLRSKREALGLYRPRRKKNSKQPRFLGTRAKHYIRAELGEAQWQAVLRKIEKHAPLVAVPEKEGQK